MPGSRAWLLVMAGALACGGDLAQPIEAAGTVEATEADLGFQLPGRIDSILVREGDQVTAGQRLAVLDRADLVARLAAATAQTQAQAARLAELQAGFRSEEIAQARAVANVAEHRLADAERDLTRARNLFAGGALSQESLDRAVSLRGAMLGERDRVTEQLRLLESGPRREQIAAQRAALAQAVAGVAQVQAALHSAEIEAPFSGVVSRRHREPGEVIGAGLPVLSLLDPGDRWVRVYLREDLVGQIGVGQTVRIAIDGYPGREYQGRVVFIADEAEFTPRNVQTREERVKLVHRIKIQIVGDSAGDLKPGLSADVVLQPR